VTFNIADGPTKTVTVPAGLENAPVFVDFVSWPGNTAGGGFGLAGGILYATISGTTLTINLNDQTVNANGCIVSYVVTGPA
jgi:hypothetical protein